MQWLINAPLLLLPLLGIMHDSTSAAADSPVLAADCITTILLLLQLLGSTGDGDLEHG